jgi:O-antigen ligase
MAKAHPFFGVGLRNFEITFNEYTDYEARAPHNAFMALMAEAGIPACLLFAAIVLSASGSCWIWFRRLRYDPSTHTLAIYALIVHATLLVYLVPNLFINRQDLDLMYHLIGLNSGMTLVMQRALLERRASVADEAPAFDAAVAPQGGFQVVHQ